MAQKYAPPRVTKGQFFKTPRDPNPCVACGNPLPIYRSFWVHMCQPCLDRQPGGSPGAQAHTLVAMAIKRGDLRKATEFACVDCGAPAREYDHRDYNKPLEVEPVCRRCNMKRGPAIPKRLTPEEQQ